MNTFPKALVFDWDNTLIDTWAVIHKALTTTFEAMDMTPWTLEETRQNVRASAREAFPALFRDRAEEAQHVFYQSYESEHLAALSPLPGSADVIRDLAGLYFDLKRFDDLQKILEHFQKEYPNADPRRLLEGLDGFQQRPGQTE